MLGAVPGIDRIRIQGFGCIEDVELELGPLQAFIGPNDSGKSTILRAVAVVAAAAIEGPSGDEPRARKGGGIAIELGQQAYRLECRTSGQLDESVTVANDRAVLGINLFASLAPFRVL